LNATFSGTRRIRALAFVAMMKTGITRSWTAMISDIDALNDMDVTLTGRRARHAPAEFTRSASR
jgi:hypothetical protein